MTAEIMLARTLDGEVRTADTLIRETHRAVSVFPFDPHLREVERKVHDIVGR